MLSIQIIDRDSLFLHLQKCFGDLGYEQGKFRRAEQATGEILALPLDSELSPEEQGFVLDATGAFDRA